MILDRGQKLAFIKNQLARYSGPKKESSGYTFVCCPFHQEKTPSFRIFHSDDSLSPGFGKCYGCGEKARWNDLAERLGLEPFEKGPPKVEHSFDLGVGRTRDELLNTGDTEKLQYSKLNFKKWRGIKASLLSDIGAKLCQKQYEDGSWSAKMLWLPVKVNNQTKGYIKARLKKQEGMTSYINAPGKWSLTYGLFPYDYAVDVMSQLDFSTMALVEGPRDALRLLSEGIPACAMLGTQSWSSRKSMLLSLADVNRVIIITDSDRAGDKARDMLDPLLREHFRVKHFRLPQGVDPFEATDKQIERLKRLVV